MKKFQAIIDFTMDDEFMNLVPPHRTYINFLINKNTIDSYIVSMESQQVWITINGETSAEVRTVLSQSPLYKYWVVTIREVFVYDGQLYRLPLLQLN